MLNKLTLLLLFFQASQIFAQDIPVGTFRDHLPYTDAVSVSSSGSIIYCATNSAIFLYDKSENTVERLNLVNGLSDIGLSKIKYNDYNGRIIITYANGNIDIIDDSKKITNLSAIKNSGITGSKKINHIYLKDNLAYLSTGFGIVVLNTDKIEIVETYFFGPLGNAVFTNAVAMDASNIYAATDQGVFFANKNSANLIDFNAWGLLPNLGVLNYDNIVTYSDRIFVSSESTNLNEDTIFYNDGGVWQKFIPNGLNVNSLNVSQNSFLISYDDTLERYDTSLAVVETIIRFKDLFFIEPAEAAIDIENNILIADKKHGLLRLANGSIGEEIHPSGPSSSNVFAMEFLKDELWIVSGGRGVGLSENLVNHNSNGVWSFMDRTFQNAQGIRARDMVSVAINPSNTSNVFVGSWRDGIFEYNNKVITNNYTAQNSVLDSAFFGITAVGTLNFDSDNNLWVTSSFASDILAVKTPDNNWYSYSFPGFTSNLDEYHDMIIDNNGYKWIANITNNNIIVFDDKKTLDDKSDDRTVLKGDLPGARLHCITMDQDGEIWLGTDEGIAVFYNPSNVFDEDIKAEQIFIEQDAQTQILLETEVVTVIAIDGANRKWIGTQSSGVFLMSEDGSEQVEHFTTTNSPLFSNSIFDIVINPKTGEVFIGTEKGLLSYKGTATDGADDYSNIFVYPNPVKPDFTGTIAIRGLVKDTDVRITDISGNIVYQTKSLGGQAVWDGKDFNGNKVQTGVYMIFNGSQEGDQKAAAKILIYH